MGLISVFLKLIDFTCVSEHTYTTKKEEIGLDVNEEKKRKCVLISGQQNAGRNRKMKVKGKVKQPGVAQRVSGS